MAQLPSAFIRQIVDLLAPAMRTPNERSALLTLAFSGEPLLRQLDTANAGAVDPFLINLTSQLWQHGDVVSGEGALDRLLTTARDYIGTDKHAALDSLSGRLRRLRQPIYLIYAHPDLYNARRIADLLREESYTVDFSDAPDGDHWAALLSARIAACGSVLYAVSAEALESEWCRWEVNQAIAQGKPLIPLLLERDAPLPDALRALSPLDLTQGVTPESAARLLAGLLAPNEPPAEAIFAPLSAPAGKPARAEALQQHAFISYSRRDQAMMIAIRDLLRAANIPVWTDESISPGAVSWKDVIERAIENAGVVVVLLSPEAKKSIWVKRELDYAEAQKKPFVPVLTSGGEADSVPFLLIGRQFIDITGGLDASATETIRETVRRDLTVSAAPPPPRITVTPTDAPKPKPKLDEAFWDVLFRLIRRERCTPFLGPAITNHLLPTRIETAKRLADSRRFPFNMGDTDLARVAQFLTFEMGEFVAKDEIVESWLRKAKRPDLNDPNEAHAILADLPLSMYLTPTYDAFLTAALLSKGKQPNRTYHYDDEWVSSRPLTGEPTPEAPLVVHVYGHQSEVESLIVSEDDYMRCLLRFARREVRFPAPVMERMGRTSYLFIGFSITDWSLRALFEILTSSLDRLGREPHIAVQVEPLRGVEPSAEQITRVEDYLRNHFRARMSANVQVYVEPTDVFLRDLRTRWTQWLKEQTSHV